MTNMPDDPTQRLLDLIDHPAPDPEVPRNPVLTHHVMERVRREHATARIARTDTRPWILGAVIVSLTALAATSTGVVDDGGLAEAAGLFDEELVLELVIGALIAAVVLAFTWRRTA
jgi:hypothetical protein